MSCNGTEPPKTMKNLGLFFLHRQKPIGEPSASGIWQSDASVAQHMSDTVRSIGLFHLAEERRRLQKHTEMKKPDQAAMSMYKRSWDDIHAAARSMHALMRSTSISSGWAARSCSIMPNACNTVAGIKARLAARSNGLASLGQSFHAAMAIFKGSRPHSTRAASWSWTNTAVSHPTSSTGPYQFTLAAPQSADGHVYALINELTLFLQHAIERVERPGGSHEGVGRKKNSHPTS